MHYLEKELNKLDTIKNSVYKLIEKGSLDGLWYWDLEKPDNEWMSPKFWETFGYNYKNKKHLVSEWKDIIFKEDFELAMQEVNKHLLDAKYPYDLIVRYKHKKGHTIWIRCRGIAIRDKNNKPIRMLGSHTNITIQKESENKYLENACFLKAILDSSLDGIMAFESIKNKKTNEILDFRIKSVNQNACKIINLKEEELLNQKLKDVLPGNFISLNTLNGSSLFEIYKEVVETGISKTMEFYFEYDGIKDWFLNKTVKFKDGFVCTFSVISDLKKTQFDLEKRIQKEISKRREQEEIINQQFKLASMGELINSIAHNWRQPLNNISLLVASLDVRLDINKKIDKFFIKSCIEKINPQIKYMSQTIDDFRDFFKKEENKTTFNLNKLIRKTLSLISPVLENNNIRYEISCNNGIEIYSMSGQLQQAILNIVNNSKDELINKKTKNPYIYINIEEEQSLIRIDILDNAGGIDNSSLLTKIFNPYFTTKNEGTGIGLFMSKTIIEKNLKGKISASNKKEGLMLSIKLPKILNN